FGAAGACFPGLTRDFFGVQFYGTACGFVLAAVPIGILATNAVFGILYDQESSKQTFLPVTDPSLSTLSDCRGNGCYSKAFAVFSVLQMISVATATGLAVLRVYDWRQKMREIERRHIGKVVGVE
ncbi:hypothetical protein HDU76_011582, partial [Blyttiomyces sp. JEL0837]